MAPLSSRNPVHLENGTPLEPHVRDRLPSLAATPYTSRMAPITFVQSRDSSIVFARALALATMILMPPRDSGAVSARSLDLEH